MCDNTKNKTFAFKVLHFLFVSYIFLATKQKAKQIFLK